MLVEISAGELVDRLTILQIKNERITDPKKAENVRHALRITFRIYRSLLNEISTPAYELITRLHGELRQINETIWDSENKIRECAAANNFDHEFVDAATTSFKNNNERSALKRQIDALFSSSLVEEKSYDIGAREIRAL